MTKLKEIKLHEDKTSNSLRDKLLPRWVYFSVRLNFTSFYRKTFRDDLSTRREGVDWMEILIRKFKLAEDGTRFPDILMYGC